MYTFTLLEARQCPHCSVTLTPRLMNIPMWDTISVNSDSDSATVVAVKFHCLDCAQCILFCAHCNHYASKCNTRNIRYFLGSSGHLHKQHSHLFRVDEENTEMVDFDHMSFGGDSDCVDNQNDNDSEDGMASCDKSVAFTVAEEEEEEEEEEEWCDDLNDYDDDEEDTTTISLVNNNGGFQMFKELFCDEPTSLFFFHQHQTFNDKPPVPGGLMGIVYRCICQQPSFGRCDPATTKTFFNLLLLLDKETEIEKEIQMDLICGILTMLQPKLQAGEEIPTFPITVEDANSMILRKPFAMRRQLPLEGLVKVDKLHAVTSIDRTIDIMMGLGVRPHFTQDEFGKRDETGINGTVAADEIVQELRELARQNGIDPDTVAIGWITIWSDSFLASFLKQKKNSAWVLTLTVCNPHGRRYESHTFVIAIGPSKTNHADVVAHVLKEVQKLRLPKLRYCGATGKFILTAFDIIVYISDRPERSDLTFTGLLGTFGKRFLWASYADEETLPSCRACFERRVKELFGIFQDTESTCSLCADWNYNDPTLPAWKTCTLAKIFENHDKGANAYPSTIDISYDDNLIPEGREIPMLTHVRPKKQTFEFLILAIKVSFYHVAIGKWWKYHLVNYLRSCGINEKVRDNCYKIAKALKDELRQRDINKEDKMERVNQFISTENLVNVGIVPEIWVSGCPLDRFIEAPMHLLFTGLCSDLFDFIIGVMARARRRTAFEERFGSVQKEMKDLKLEWLKSGELPATQWASENYIAMARVLPFAFGFYCNGFNAIAGGITEGMILSVQQLVNAFSMMIASLMRVDGDIKTTVIERHIKIFLSCLNHCERSKITGNDNNNNNNNQQQQGNAIFTKGNPLSLLNIIDQIDRYGAPRLFWEGNNEFSIQMIKDLIDHVRYSLSFFESKLTQHQRSRCLDQLRQSMDSGTREPRTPKRFHRYQSIHAIESVLNSGHVVSVVKFDSYSSLFVAFCWERSNANKFVKVEADPNIGGILERCGLIYCRFRLVSNDHIVLDDDVLRKEMKTANCGVLLSSGDNYFCLIMENWMTLTETGNIDYPVISRNIFNI